MSLIKRSLAGNIKLFPAVGMGKLTTFFYSVGYFSANTPSRTDGYVLELSVYTSANNQVLVFCNNDQACIMLHIMKKWQRNFNLKTIHITVFFKYLSDLQRAPCIEHSCACSGLHITVFSKAMVRLALGSLTDASRPLLLAYLGQSPWPTYLHYITVNNHDKTVPYQGVRRRIVCGSGDANNGYGGLC
jgi:hypothetical protein